MTCLLGQGFSRCWSGGGGVFVRLLWDAGREVKTVDWTAETNGFRLLRYFAFWARTSGAMHRLRAHHTRLVSDFCCIALLLSLPESVVTRPIFTLKAKSCRNTGISLFPNIPDRSRGSIRFW